MSQNIKDFILRHLKATDCREIEKVQELWSGYGSILRYHLEGHEIQSVIVKHIHFPTGKSHPRGWNTNISHQRKLHSYEVETYWYQNWSQRCTPKSYLPKCYAVEKKKDEVFILLEDLDASGFNERKRSVNLSEIKLCLKWLAHFHASFINQEPEGLWDIGTYWHLNTRPDELKALKDKPLRQAASLIDEKLNQAAFKTFVHGDAKLANFCFSPDSKKVAAVDFQYVGGGCGMKDIAYFIGSCLDEHDCEVLEEELLTYYFSVLSNVLKSKDPQLDIKGLEEEWRMLYPIAWTDFHRFIKGWSPGHWKINTYSERVAKKVVEQLCV